MKLVMPLGRDEVALGADFDITPYYGCACSNENGKWLTEKYARQEGDKHPCHCYCQCSYGSENDAANNQLGQNSNDW